MRLLARLREWLLGEDADRPGESGHPDRSEQQPSPDTPENSENQRLDPDNVTEVRESTDSDPVEQLREVTQQEEAGENPADDRTDDENP
jgi:hypothetical protein